MTILSAVRRALGVAQDIVAAAGVGAAAALFAHGFREAMFWVGEHALGEHSPVGAYRHSALWRLGVVAAVAMVGAVLAARLSRQRAEGRLGISHLAAGVGSPDSAPRLRWTLLHSAATWLVAAAGLSIGRESAIIETGGAIGGAVGRRRRGRGTLVAAGVGGAFAAAYHAPFSAVVYGADHLRLGRSRRGLMCTGLGAATGYGVAIWLFGSAALLPGVSYLSWRMVATCAIGVLPAAALSMLFRAARDRAVRPLPWWGRLAAGGVALGAVVAAPVVAGNGLEALRETQAGPVLRVVLTLALVKLVATSATLAAGAPGGVFSPTLAVGGAAAASAVLLVLPGWADDPAVWAACLCAMAVSIAIGLRSPLLGAVVVFELTANWRVLPLSVCGAALVWVVGFVWRRVRHLAFGIAPVDDSDG